MSTRTYRHAVLEGPDGSGKSTLAKYLAATMDVPLAPRISDSLKGVAGTSLSRYVTEDMSRWRNFTSSDPAINGSAFSSFEEPTPSRIYDRYPLISEPIYGLHVRKGVQPEFGTGWYRDAYSAFLAMDPIVIWCLPPYDEVAKNVNPERDIRVLAKHPQPVPGVQAGEPQVPRHMSLVRLHREQALAGCRAHPPPHRDLRTHLHD